MLLVLFSPWSGAKFRWKFRHHWRFFLCCRCVSISDEPVQDPEPLPMGVFRNVAITFITACAEGLRNIAACASYCITRTANTLFHVARLWYVDGIGEQTSARSSQNVTGISQPLRDSNRSSVTQRRVKNRHFSTHMKNVAPRLSHSKGSWHWSEKCRGLKKAPVQGCLLLAVVMDYKGWE